MVPLKRLYLRDLPNHVGEDALLKYLSSYGKIHEVKIVHDYAFVQFDSEKDARDVLETFQRQPFLGKNIVVEFARPLRKDMPSITSSNTKSSWSRIRSRQVPDHVQARYPVVVTDIPRNIRWQELKDFGRTSGGLVAYCDLDRKKRGRGFIEYFLKEDAERAVQELNGKCLGGKCVTVSGINVIYQRSRSRSPTRCRSPDRNRASPPVSDPLYQDADTRHWRDSPPPSYAYRHTHGRSALYYHAQHMPPRYHSPVPSSIEAKSSPPVQYIPNPRHVEPYGEEYGYTSYMPRRMDNWKYDYHGYTGGYNPRIWEERTEHQAFDPFQYYHY